MVEIDGFKIDAELSSNRVRSAEVTTRVVEDGSTMSDHVRLDPLIITVTGIVSDYPVGPLADERGLNPTAEALRRLDEIFLSKAPVTVLGELDEYENMMLRNLSTPRDSSTGAVLDFTAEFVKIRTVSNERTTVPVSVPVAAPVKRRGRRRPKSLKAKTQQPRTGQVEDDRAVVEGEGSSLTVEVFESEAQRERAIGAFAEQPRGSFGGGGASGSF